MKKDIYKKVTDSIIEQIEGGVLPWVQPWTSKGLTAGLPINAISNNAYSGINVLILWAYGINNGYQSGKFLTFKQAKKLGGGVKKGEHGVKISYADKFIPKKERKQAESEGRNPFAIPFLKAYTLFNIEQCENLPDDLYESAVDLPDCEKIESAEKIMADSGARIVIQGGKAFYMPSSDYIQLPPQPAFPVQSDYYCTAFHELGHWTGHKSRLNRKSGTKKGDTGYAFEELVAEITSAFICATLGIQPTVRHADYIASWLVVLKNDKRAIFKAASLATKAAKLLLDNDESAAKIAA